MTEVSAPDKNKPGDELYKKQSYLGLTVQRNSHYERVQEAALYGAAQKVSHQEVACLMTIDSLTVAGHQCTSARLRQRTAQQDPVR